MPVSWAQDNDPLMHTPLFFVAYGIISLVLGIINHFRCQEIKMKGKRVPGLVKYRFWTHKEYMRNHWETTFTAIVEFESSNSNIIEQELKRKKTYYIPPASGKLIYLIIYTGEVYDERMLNRKLEISLSALVIIAGLAYYFFSGYFINIL